MDPTEPTAGTQAEHLASNLPDPPPPPETATVNGGFLLTKRERRRLNLSESQSPSPPFSLPYAHLGALLAYVSRCTYLGGYGFSVPPSQVVDVVFATDGLIAGHATVRQQWGYAEMREIEVSGRGSLKSGGGFIGGGFGLEGAATGIAIATLLNSVTTRSHMETLLRIESTDAEMFFHNGAMTPAALRMSLSPAIARLPQRVSPQATPVADIGTQLEHLAQLHRSGALSDEEFALAKSKLLSS